MRRTNGVSADGKESFQRLTVSSVWIEFHVSLRERVELTVTTNTVFFVCATQGLRLTSLLTSNDRHEIRHTRSRHSHIKLRYEKMSSQREEQMPRSSRPIQRPESRSEILRTATKPFETALNDVNVLCCSICGNRREEVRKI